MPGKIDLHLHTTASDGSDTPRELLLRLRAAGIETFAVTDHDTVAGAQEMAGLPLEGLRFIPGIEFSCFTAAGKCHILGYGCDFEDAAFGAVIEAGRARRQEKLARRLEYLRERWGIALTGDELAWLNAQSSPGKPHFGRILMARGLADSVSAAVERYFGGLKEAQDRIPAVQALAAIRHAGGVGVWAHPLGGEGEPRLSTEGMLRQLDALLGFGLRGMECCYSRYGAAETALLRATAADNGLLVSGGSDYHGANKKGIALGQLNTENTEVGEDVLTVLDAL